MARQEIEKAFDERKIRSVWDDKAEKWFFAVVDVVAALTDSANPTDYIKKMRKRDPFLSEGWGQLVTPPFINYRRRSPTHQLCRCGRDVPHYSVNTLAEGRTIQAMDGACCR